MTTKNGVSRPESEGITATSGSTYEGVLWHMPLTVPQAMKPVTYVVGFSFAYLFFRPEVAHDFVQNIFLILYPTLFGLCMLVLPVAILDASGSRFGRHATGWSMVALAYLAVSVALLVGLLAIATTPFRHGETMLVSGRYVEAIPFFPLLISVGGTVSVFWFLWVLLAMRIYRGAMQRSAKHWLDKGDANALTRFGMTPLQTAAQAGDANLLEFLIDRGADVNCKGEGGVTALHVAGSARVAEALISAGADVSARTADGSTPLHWARSKETAEALIAAGADVGARTNEGRTPLHECFRTSVAEVLVAGGADVNAVDSHGKSPLHEFLLPDALECLIAAKADVNLKAEGGMTPLHAVAKGAVLECAQVLLNNGADVNARTGDGETPLRIAERSGQWAMAQLLKRSGGVK